MITKFDAGLNFTIFHRCRVSLTPAEIRILFLRDHRLCQRCTDADDTPTLHFQLTNRILFRCRLKNQNVVGRQLATKRYPALSATEPSFSHYMANLRHVRAGFTTRNDRYGACFTGVCALLVAGQSITRKFSTLDLFFYEVDTQK